jgi:5-formyltetrahydrofolate cyclo-ligase
VMPEKPLAIGVGFELSQMETIHPQPHDIPMGVIVTEQRVIRVADALPKIAGPQCSDGSMSR